MSENKGPKLTVLSSDSDFEDVVSELPTISEMRNFSDGEGRNVMGEYPIDNPEDPKYTGIFTVQSSMGPLRMQMEFPKGNSIRDCFNQFDGLAQETIQKAQDEVNDRNRIVTPDQLRHNTGIITP